jgi:hypothetical protein
VKDYLGNNVDVDDTVIIAVRSGKYATLGRAFVIDKAFRPYFSGGQPTNMIRVEWSNLHKFWIPASKVLRVSDDMLPEKRREKLNETEEAVQPS